MLSENPQYFYNQLTEEYLKVNGRILLNGYESIIIIESKEPITCIGEYLQPPRVEKAEYECNIRPQLDYSIQCSKAELVCWDVNIDGKNYGNQHFAQVRDLIGTECASLINNSVRPGLDNAPLAKSQYPVKAVFQADFELEQTNGKVYLLIEGDTIQGDYRIEINGHVINKEWFKPYYVYDFTNMTADISELAVNGINHISIIFEKAYEFDGLCSSIYII